MTSPQLRHAAGLDLGQRADPSALALIQWDAALTEPIYTVRTLKRWALQTRYRDVVGGVIRFLQTPELADALLAVDDTGCGAAVAEAVREDLAAADVPAVMHAITITAGRAVTMVGTNRWHVAKLELVSTLAVVLGERRLCVPPELPEAEVLVAELENFKVRVTTALNEVFGVWRAGINDDVCLATMMAVWLAERSDPPQEDAEPEVLVEGFTPVGGPRVDPYAGTRWETPSGFRRR